MKVKSYLWTGFELSPWWVKVSLLLIAQVTIGGYFLITSVKDATTTFLRRLTERRQT